MVSTLLVDNYDSFTYNLYALLAAVNGTEPPSSAMTHRGTQ